MTQSDFDDIVSMCLCSGAWTHKERERHRKISLQLIIAVTFYWLAHGLTFRTLQFTFGYVVHPNLTIQYPENNNIRFGPESVERYHSWGARYFLMA